MQGTVGSSAESSVSLSCDLSEFWLDCAGGESRRSRPEVDEVPTRCPALYRAGVPTPASPNTARVPDRVGLHFCTTSQELPRRCSRACLSIRCMQTTGTPWNSVRARLDLRAQRFSRRGRAGPAMAIDRHRAAPRLSLLRTAGGWALCDATDRAVFEAEGPGARQACLARALALGVVCLRAGEEMWRRPGSRGVEGSAS
jgi:hypothetical protein